MRLVTILLVLAAMAASTKVALQRRALVEAKLERAALRAENDPMLAQTQMDVGTSEELERLRGETRDLPKLRNEVRQLRSELSQLSRLRVENERLLKALQSAPTNSVADARPPTPPGFTDRESLAESGQATPEATVQSFLRAMRDGDVQRFMQCMAPDFRKDFTEDMDANQTAKLGEKLKEDMAAFSNFRIVERKESSPDYIQLSLQSSTGPSVMRVGVRKIGNEWLMDKPF
jgi:uncharacterized protein DUF4878